MSELFDCNNQHAEFDETKHKGSKSIDDLLQQPFDKHIGSFEIPESIKHILDTDQINAAITWYLKWKITEPLDTQNTCTIKNIFGYVDGMRIIVAINLYKYLRNKGYDPEVIEKFNIQ